MRSKLVCAILYFLLSGSLFAQTDIVKTEGIKGAVHEANRGKITFMSQPIPVESFRETDFLKTFELKPSGNLYLRAFMDNSLTNYLHRLAPDLSAEELIKRGNYQFSFFVDNALVYTENLHVGSGLPETKH